MTLIGEVPGKTEEWFPWKDPEDRLGTAASATHWRVTLKYQLEIIITRSTFRDCMRAS